MKIEEFNNWYHGSPNKFEKFTEQKSVNRTTNIAGVYLTQSIEVAEEHANNGYVYKVEPMVSNTFVQNKNSYNDPRIIDAMIELVPKYHPAYSSEWTKKAIVPEMIELNRFKLDMSGDLKREVLIRAGYDSYIFKDMFDTSLVVFDPKNAKIIARKSLT